MTGRFRAAGLLTFLFCLACLPAFADAKQRHAFIVGIGDYDSKSGLAVLHAPANDASEMKFALERLPQPFNVVMITDDQAKDRDAFQAEFDRFLSRVDPGDDVLFYFSGHGFSADKKNYYLTKSSKSDTAFFKDLGTAELRELDTADKKAKRYRDFIIKVALSEEEIERAIAGRKPDVIILVADACRSPIEGAKGAALDVPGVVLPARSAFGTYRLYSASEGQISLDSLEPISRPGANEVKSRDEKGATKEKPKKNSLFTRVLLSQIPIPGQPLLVMAAQVKSKVREQARKLNKDQIPDYNEDSRSTDYFFWPSEGDPDQAALCQWSDTELQNLRSGIASGSLGRDTIEQRFAELSRCGANMREQLRALRQIEVQGTGSFISQAEQTIDASKLKEPQQICDAKGSSPLDPDRPQLFGGSDVQKLVASALSAGKDRDLITLDIKSVIEACEQAAKQRPRVARYKFNAARANYALASLTNGFERTVALKRASSLNQDAVDLGYAAAYNNLAVMIQNGEYYKENAKVSRTCGSRRSSQISPARRRSEPRGRAIQSWNGLSPRRTRLRQCFQDQ